MNHLSVPVSNGNGPQGRHNSWQGGLRQQHTFQQPTNQQQPPSQTASLCSYGSETAPLGTQRVGWQRFKRTMSQLFLGRVGDSTPRPNARIVPRLGSTEYNGGVVNHGLSKVVVGDIYHFLLDLSWSVLVLISFFRYIGEVTFFGACYYLCGDVAGCQGQQVTFAEGVWLAIQTQATIGYGLLSPGGVCSSNVVVIHAWVAFVGYAALAGIIFAKTSRANLIKHNFEFSKVAVITDQVEHFEGDETTGEGRYVQGAPCLVFRVVNTRKASVCNPTFHLLYAWRKDPRLMHNVSSVDASENPATEEVVIQEMDFELNRQVGRVRTKRMSHPFLGLPWTVVHHINESSPLYGCTPETILAVRGEVIAVLDGVDEAVSHNLQARWSWVAQEIIWNARFEPMISLVTPDQLHSLSRGHAVKAFPERPISSAETTNHFWHAMRHLIGCHTRPESDSDHQPKHELANKYIYVVDCGKLNLFTKLPGKIALPGSSEFTWKDSQRNNALAEGSSLDGDDGLVMSMRISESSQG